MMFQRALPELKGFGVKMRIPGFSRSDQVVMWSGLPLGTTKTTTESVTIPFVVGFAFQFGATNLGTSFSMSLASEKLTTSAGWPAATAFSWLPEGPKDWLKLMFLPIWVLL